MKPNSIAALFLLLNLVTPTVRAQETPTAEETPRPSRFYSGLMWGNAVSTTSPTAGTDNFVFGGRFGVDAIQARFLHLSFGLTTQFLNDRATVSGTTVKAWASLMMSETLLRRAFSTGLYFGARAGVAALSSKVSTNTTSQRAATATFVVGPVMGYEFQIIPTTSLNFDVSWLTVGGGTLKFDTASVDLDPSSSLFIQGGINFHF